MKFEWGLAVCLMRGAVVLARGVNTVVVADVVEEDP
jgi:hypothetical protein